MLNSGLMDALRELSVASVALRLFLAAALGGVIGAERWQRGQPAGLRTHILVCMGACLAMLANLYVVGIYPGADPTRFGAQVISGIGFLGVGTIIITGRRQVKGLTTAAGLWASACMGLALGAGFYEGALISFAVIFIAMTLLHRLEGFIRAKRGQVYLYAEFVRLTDFRAFTRHLKDRGIVVLSADLAENSASSESPVSAVFRLRLDKKRQDSAVLLDELSALDGVLMTEKL